MRIKKPMKILGKTDRLDFPELDLYDIQSKTDTGAYTSSIHCHHIETFAENGTEYVSFYLLDPEHESYNNKKIVMPLHKVRKVKSSNGQMEKRCSIKTKIVIYGKKYTIELTLTDRSDMKFPVLLGRKILSEKFLVDVSKNDLSYSAKQEKL